MKEWEEEIIDTYDGTLETGVWIEAWERKERVTELLSVQCVLISIFFTVLTKRPDRNNFKEEEFILGVHGFRGLGPQTAGSIPWE